MVHVLHLQFEIFSQGSLKIFLMIVDNTDDKFLEDMNVDARLLKNRHIFEVEVILFSLSLIH